MKTTSLFQNLPFGGASVLASRSKHVSCGSRVRSPHPSDRVLQTPLLVLNLFLLATALSSFASDPDLVLTQMPAAAPTNASPSNYLARRYLPGSRIVLARAPLQPKKVRVLSAGLHAAGGPVLTRDARSVLFVGQAEQDGDWQVYTARLDGGRPELLTQMPGGAMSPDVLSSGDLVFISPVPRLGEGSQTPPCASIYAEARGGVPHRLTFTASDITGLTVLNDGRILFVSGFPESTPEQQRQAFFTVRSDGTEFSLFAGQHEVPQLVRRPREVGDGIVFLASPLNTTARPTWPRAVPMGQPFSAPRTLFPFVTGPCRSIEDGGDGTFIVSLEKREDGDPAARASSAIFRLNTNASGTSKVLFNDVAWQDIEAVPVTPRPPPKGFTSARASGKKTGTILCLDANFTSYRALNEEPPRIVRIRLLARRKGETIPVGEVPVQADGSFTAEVPADVPLGFEALDAQGAVVRREAPSVWLRAGEKRTCAGCHEPHGRLPGNHRS